MTRQKIVDALAVVEAQLNTLSLNSEQRMMLEAQKLHLQQQLLVSGEKTGEKKPGGRPRKASHEWARVQVHDLEREATAVFWEWLEMDDNRSLSNPEDSFKKAIEDKPKN